MTAVFDLLEREAAIGTLGDALASTRSGDGCLIFVSGDAGAGKTTLVRTFCSQVADARILVGSCDGLRTPRPLGPFVEIAGALGGRVAELVTESATPRSVFDALVDELRGPGEAIVVLEDVHWSDEATLDALRVLGRRVGQLGALVVVTYRADELPRTHPLRIVLGDLATADNVVRLKVGPLSADAVAKLAADHGIDSRELHAKTGGNPFFVTEVLASGSADVPDTVRDAVLARATRLTPAARELLDAVAIVPQRTELWLVEAIAGDLESALDACLGSGMLQAEDQSVAFRHEIARLAVEDSINPLRRIELHRAALRALRAASSPDLARLVHHADAAGDSDAVLELAPAAAAAASAVGAHREAAAHYARALRFADSLPPSERAALLERRSWECYLTTQDMDAKNATEAAIVIYRELGDRIREGDARRSLARVLANMARVPEARRAAEDAIDVLEDLPRGHELALAYAARAGFEILAEDKEEGTLWPRRGSRWARGSGTPSRTRARSSPSRCSRRCEGRPMDGRRSMTRSPARSKAAPTITSGGSMQSSAWPRAASARSSAWLRTPTPGWRSVRSTTWRSGGAISSRCAAGSSSSAATGTQQATPRRSCLRTAARCHRFRRGS